MSNNNIDRRNFLKVLSTARPLPRQGFYMDVVEILSGKVCRRPEAIWVKSRQIR